MKQEELALRLEHWSFPLGPFLSLGAAEKEREEYAQALGAQNALVLLDTIVVVVEQQPALEWAADDLLYAYYQQYTLAIRLAINARMKTHYKTLYFVNLLNILPEGAPLIDNLSLAFVVEQSTAWQIAFLGVIRLLRRLKDRELVLRIMQNTTEEDLLEEGMITLQYFQQ